MIWRLADPNNPFFAHASWRGAWTLESASCPQCNSTEQRRKSPLICEWESGSDKLGDFTCTGGCRGFLISEEVGLELCTRFHGLELGTVEYYQVPNSKQPTSANSRTKPRIWLPYKGPPLVELLVTALVHMDSKQSSARRVVNCATCGLQKWEIDGVETLEAHWDKERRLPFYLRRPRKPGHGFIVRKEELHGVDFFRILEFDGWDLCTDDVKRFMEEKGYTNIDFYEVGDIV